MSRAADSTFGDDEPEPRGRPLECELCGSGSHNRSLCPWEVVEKYLRARRNPAAHSRGPAEHHPQTHKPLTLEQSRAMQNANWPLLEELSAHLDSQQAPKPAPSLGRRRQDSSANPPSQAPVAPTPSRLRLVLRALRDTLFGYRR